MNNQELRDVMVECAKDIREMATNVHDRASMYLREIADKLDPPTDNNEMSRAEPMTRLVCFNGMTINNVQNK